MGNRLSLTRTLSTQAFSRRQSMTEPMHDDTVPISELEAREAFLQARSEASHLDYFDAERREHGWVFGWREDRGDAPVGTHTWVVADNGRVPYAGRRSYDWCRQRRCSRDLLPLL